MEETRENILEREMESAIVAHNAKLANTEKRVLANAEVIASFLVAKFPELLELLPYDPDELQAERAEHYNAIMEAAESLDPKYNKWDNLIGCLLERGKIVEYDGELFEVVQSHVAQSDWKPSEAPALFKPYNEAEESGNDDVETIAPAWTRPTGAHDAYNIGDKITFEGRVFASIINGNIWSPTEYPAGWQLVA